jgi:hypothetical protein
LTFPSGDFIGTGSTCTVNAVVKPCSNSTNNSLLSYHFTELETQNPGTVMTLVITTGITNPTVVRTYSSF